MIRIDEIYNNTFWPWIDQHVPHTRMFFCDPPGRSDPDALHNFGRDDIEYNYIFFHDQEPIHLDLHRPLFDDVVTRNTDMCWPEPPLHRALVTSEWSSDCARELCKIYGWTHYYYFYHGWAALDWYRGYDRTWLMPRPDQREITRSFIAPNRIMGGKRDHRILLMYHMIRDRPQRAWISCPATCPYEQQSVVDLAGKFLDIYPDVSQIFAQAGLPWDFPGETGHPMHSCWLSLFDLCAETLAYVVTETVYFGRRNHITEKTFKPICQQMPFVIASAAGSLEYLRRYGFQTFGSIWDESYDHERDDMHRLEKIAALLRDLDAQSPRELQAIYRATLPMVEHNYRHFYGGDFERLLWQELTDMLKSIQDDFRI